MTPHFDTEIRPMDILEVDSSQSIDLDLGDTCFSIELPCLPHPILLDHLYAPFLQDSASDRRPDVVVHTFVEQADVEGWREAEELFGSRLWSLHRHLDRLFVVCTAINASPVPFWVARTDASINQIHIANLEPCPEEARELVVNSALAIIGRLAVMHRLLTQPRGLLLHTAAVSINELIFLLPGVSGAGKSTLSRLFLEHDEAPLINDDRMIVTRETEASWTTWGTPWPGELCIARNVHGPLGALLFLDQSPRTFVEPLTPVDALNRLLTIASIPWYDMELVTRALDLCEQMVQEIPAYALKFRPDTSAVEAVKAVADTMGLHD